MESQDYLKAKEYYEQAASQGNLVLNIMQFLYRGYGVTQDYLKAKEYYEQAASQGHSGSQHNLGVLYLKDMESFRLSKS